MGSQRPGISPRGSGQLGCPDTRVQKVQGPPSRPTVEQGSRPRSPGSPLSALCTAPSPFIPPQCSHPHPQHTHSLSLCHYPPSPSRPYSSLHLSPAGFLLASAPAHLNELSHRCFRTCLHLIAHSERHPVRPDSPARAAWQHPGKMLLSLRVPPAPAPLPCLAARCAEGAPTPDGSKARQGRAFPALH